MKPHHRWNAKEVHEFVGEYYIAKGMFAEAVWNSPLGHKASAPK